MFPKIVGFPPKSSILIGFSIINHPFWGTTNFWKHPHGVVRFMPPRFSPFRGSRLFWINFSTTFGATFSSRRYRHQAEPFHELASIQAIFENVGFFLQNCKHNKQMVHPKLVILNLFFPERPLSWCWTTTLEVNHHFKHGGSFWKMTNPY